MLLADAQAELSSLVAADAEPTLSSEELQRLLNQSLVVDAERRSPGHPLYVPTWNLNYAAMKGWQLKAAKSAEVVGVSTDGQSVQADQLFEHCLTMMRMFRDKLAFSIELPSSLSARVPTLPLP